MPELQSHYRDTSSVLKFMEVWRQKQIPSQMSPIYLADNSAGHISSSTNIAQCCLTSVKSQLLDHSVMPIQKHKKGKTQKNVISRRMSLTLACA